MKKSLLIFFILVLASYIFASSQATVSQANKIKLRRLSIKLANDWTTKHNLALKKAKQLGIPEKIYDEKGLVMQLQYFSNDGTPQYYTIDNKNAAITISTNEVYSGGSAGLSLNGNGFLVREWDGGGVRASHQEFGSPTRVSNGDGVSGTHYHSTHVAGTIMAAGVDSNAKGMAFQANLKYFDWNSDTSEMATEASAGMLLSNHSYGYSRGWVYNPSTGKWDWYGNSTDAEDPNFGFYDNNSKNFDQVMYDAPNYLICKAAGNDRGDGPGSPDNGHPEDGPYDCLDQLAVSKNSLVVAAVEDLTTGYTQPSDVVMSSFSSWGPCDDGRIKPDISANGVGVYSTYDTNDTAYQSLNGTSMATPSVTGSLTLIQEHYEDVHGSGNYLRGSTLKALAIHCADEAGNNPGPDYSFGWGLLNIKRMAEYITEDNTATSSVLIDELTLSNGATYVKNVTANGTDPLKVTIAWTDVPGTPVAVSVDPPNPMLVNDLDIRISDGSNTYYPWKLDKNNPSNAATNSGDNAIDNVEQIYIASPAAGSYTITVSHKGTIVDDSGSTSSQQYAMIISGLATGNPTCSITSPADGAFIKKGTTQNITADSNDPAKSVSKVDFYIDNTFKGTDNSSPYEYSWDTSSYSLGSHTIKAISTDDASNTGQDEITITLYEPKSIPWTDNCNSGTDWDIDDGSGTWQNVNPTNPADDHTGGGNCFFTNGNTDYDSGTSYILTSPIIDLSTATNCSLTFWMWMDVESNTSWYDGGFLEVWNGSAWVAATNSILSTNYDGTLSSSYGNPYGGSDAWSADRSSWTQITVDLSTYSNADFKFRYKFGADSSNNAAGWAIDDVELTGTTSSLSAPNATAATSITSSGFTANWDTVTGATGYYLDLATDNGFSSMVSGYNNLDVGKVTSKAVTGLTASTDYYYRVRAYDGTNTSSNSNTISVTTTASGSSGSVTDVRISEISDASTTSSEYIELYNPNGTSYDLTGAKLVRANASDNSSEYVFDIGTDGSGDTVIPANGILIIARGSSKASFESDWGITLGANVNYNTGIGDLYFGTGTARRWRLRMDGAKTADTDDGTIIDDTNGAAGGTNNRTYQPTNGNFVTESSSGNSTPGTNDTEEPLPVTLSSFTSEYTNGKAILQWVTMSEENSSQWNVYRSPSNNYGQSSQINAEPIAGANNSTEATHYTYKDDTNLEADMSYYYWIENISYSGESSLFGPVELVVEQNGNPDVPDVMIYGLQQNYPNPFNPATKIKFALKEDAHTYLSIYNIKGEKIKSIINGTYIPKDELKIYSWDGTNSNGKKVSSGIYMYKLKAGKYSSIKRMILLK